MLHGSWWACEHGFGATFNAIYSQLTLILTSTSFPCSSPKPYTTSFMSLPLRHQNAVGCGQLLLLCESEHGLPRALRHRKRGSYMQYVFGSGSSNPSAWYRLWICGKAARFKSDNTFSSLYLSISYQDHRLSWLFSVSDKSNEDSHVCLLLALETSYRATCALVLRRASYKTSCHLLSDLSVYTPLYSKVFRT